MARRRRQPVDQSMKKLSGTSFGNVLTRKFRSTSSISVWFTICRLINKPEGGTKAEVKMTLTAPGRGMGPAIARDAQNKILTIGGVDETDVQLVWDPPWNQNMISEAGRMKLGMI
jgi:hypothetical protein